MRRYLGGDKMSTADAATNRPARANSLDRPRRRCQDQGRRCPGMSTTVLSTALSLGLIDAGLYLQVRHSLASLATRPKSLQVIEWGPHDLTAEARADWAAGGGSYPFDLKHPARRVFRLPAGEGAFADALDVGLRKLGRPPWPLVRVRFRLEDAGGKEHTLDLLLALRRGRLAIYGHATGGKRWREFRGLK